MSPRVSNRRPVRAGARRAGSPRRSPARRLAALLLATAIAAPLSPARAATPPEVEALARLTIEELAEIEVTTVLRRPAPISRAPASIYVITAEDIRRSGATSLPEVLRLAPNLHVVRDSATDYAISARGFNTVEASIKQLVLIDGRSIYTPLFGGVLWDQHQVPLAEIERIEVISGPGGTLWGANAMNGVINIITKTSAATQGGLAVGRLGTLDRDGMLRYDGTIGENTTWRAYTLGFDRGDTVFANGDEANDGWQGRQVGFRTDWSAGSDTATFQGDLYDGALRPGDLDGGNLVGRWTRQLATNSALEVQGFFERSAREVPGVNDTLEVYDLEAQHSVLLGERHNLVWGGGYRFIEDEFVNNLNVFVLRPPRDSIQLANIFAQDSIALAEDVTLTLGTKVEHSSYSGFEILPSVLLGWQAGEDTFLWSSVSRAVRSPTRFDRDLTAQGILEPGRDFESEELVAYEAGYRGRPTEQTSVSVSLFFHDYDDLRGLAATPGGLLRLDNVMEGHTYGLEAWADYKPLSWWRLFAGVSLLKKKLELKPGGLAAALEQHRGNDPEHQFKIRSYMNLTDRITLDLALRIVDDLPSPRVPGYAELDARLGWQVTDTLEVSIAGLNLLNDHHPETGAAADRREIPRSAHIGVRWRF